MTEWKSSLGLGHAIPSFRRSFKSRQFVKVCAILYPLMKKKYVSLHFILFIFIFLLVLAKKGEEERNRKLESVGSHYFGATYQGDHVAWASLHGPAQCGIHQYSHGSFCQLPFS